MLERLDTIPWSRLRCQVGHAGHVPAAVRGLLSEDVSVVEKSYWQLENHVVVQGTLYEAAAYLPEVLFEVLNLATYKGAVLGLLFEIGNGYSPDDPNLRHVCHQAVVSGLEKWLAESVTVEPKWREGAERDVSDLRKYAKSRIGTGTAPSCGE